MNKRIKKKREKLNNKKLCQDYPFLIPYNRWTGKVCWEKKKYRRIYKKCKLWYTPPYAFTELDAMPDGWRKKFGLQMCEEIKQELIKFNYLHKYRIMQIKEKYGELRWYDAAIPKDSQIWDIIDKYSELSRHTCICCGRPAEIINNRGWFEPLCESCLEKEKM